MLSLELNDIISASFAYDLHIAAHTDNENYLSRALERLGTAALSKDQEAEIGAAFIKFSIVTKELSALLRTLVSLFISFLYKSILPNQSFCDVKRTIKHNKKKEKTK